MSSIKQKLRKKGWFFDGVLSNAMPVDLSSLPWWEKYMLSVEEAAAYFRIGENKLRKLIASDRNADYIFWNGNRPQIKRKKFATFIDAVNAV